MPVCSLDQKDALDDGMAANSSTLAWRLPWNRGAIRVIHVCLCVCMYIYFFRFLSVIDYYMILNMVPCNIRYDLVAYIFYLE